MFFLDPLYLMVMGVGLVLSLGAQFWVKSRVNRWGQVPTARGMTGADVARAILRAEGIRDVRVEEVTGFLSDHYSPGERGPAAESGQLPGRLDRGGGDRCPRSRSRAAAPPGLLADGVASEDGAGSQHRHQPGP